MALIPGNSVSVIQANYRHMMDIGYDPIRALAAAFHNAGRPDFQGRSHKKAGVVKVKLPKKNAMRTTPLKGNTGFGLTG